MNFQINYLSPILWTDNISETILFYTKNLDFHVLEENEEWGWAALGKGDTKIMFSKPNNHYPHKIVFSGSFYFNVNNIEVFWEDIKSKVKICYPLEIFDWGMKEFAIYDNNGYILQFGEDVANSTKKE